jgi:hypothetical protein
MKTLKNVFFMAAVMPLLASCLGDNGGNSYSGFSGVNGYVNSFANNTQNFLSFNTFSKWNLEAEQGGDWCKPAATSGSANQAVTMNVALEQNTTGSPRAAIFNLYDVNDRSISVRFQLRQYATRGDGSLGNAALVKAITGSDGSAVAIEYDALNRPRKLNIALGSKVLHDMDIRYNDADTVITVNTGKSTLSAVFDRGYQVSRLLSSTDTVGYYSQYVDGVVVSTRAFNFENHHADGSLTAYSYLMNGQPLSPDSIHNADSLRYLHLNASGDKYIERMKMEYSKTDNRCQSVDVNQLLLGISECDPYLLLSMFRLARNTNIVSRAETADGSFVVEATLNADKSVSTLTVTDKAGAKVTYTFTY